MGLIGSRDKQLGIYWDNGKENGNYYSILELYWGYIGVIMENHMEKKMENEMETGIIGF